MPKKSKKKETDYEALHSSFMQIPSMKTEIARGMMDAGIREAYELRGRAPEVVLEGMLAKHPALKGIPDLRERVELAVYFMETDDPDPRKLRLSHWSSIQ